jgi:aspartyl/asparaginyl beta-hydroxylase (cupin superfamily)
MIFRRRIDAVATALASTCVAVRWRQVSGRQGAARAQSPYQRPHFYFAGLTARPWWNPADFSWVEYLEQHAEVLRAELHHLCEMGFLKPPPIETIAPEKRDLDQMLIRSGAWHLYRLYYNGVELTENCERCPTASRLFRMIPGQWGTVGFGVLAPGTRIAPHCGPSNAKLRCHLGLEIPDGCGIRVERDTRTWRNGRCIVFDDSFEHEVWNTSDRPRYIFLIDVHHPDLTVRERLWLENLSRRIIKMAPRHMRKALESEPRAQPTAAV